MKVKLKSFIPDHLEISTPFLKKENIIKLPHKDIKYLICDFCFIPASPLNGPIILLCLTSMKNLGGRLGKCLTQIRIFFFLLPEICDYIIGTFILQDTFTI